MTRYNNKTYRIDKIARDKKPTDTFKDGEAQSGVSGPIYLIPELCSVTGLSDDQRANFNLMKSMGEYTRQDPAKCTNMLMKFSEILNSNKEIAEEMQGWNLKFAQDLLKFQSRILKPKTILGNNHDLCSNYILKIFLSWVLFG